ncbi:MAG: hypothetical protein ACAF41_33865 (plasmid) [Leptolyngbya sp. BL-A-14]
MVLLDHFRPPLNARRHWHSFHSAWSAYIAADLNQSLPEEYFAEPNVQLGIEIDVATFEETTGKVVPLPVGNRRNWSPPVPNQTIAFQPAAESVEISIFSNQSGPKLVGAIKLVSPANKDRLDHRQAFVAKCELYLRQGLGLVVVDVVTGRKANLHDELLERITASGATRSHVDLYASTYHVLEWEDQPSLDLWLEVLEVGRELPTLPLWLPGGLCLPVKLNATYARTC